MQENDYKWIVAGHDRHLLIAILCKLEEPSEFEGFWWVNEPVGHALHEDDLYDTREEAEEELRSRLKEAIHPEDADLVSYRSKRINFIESTRKVAGLSTAIYPGTYVIKKENESWFGRQHL